MIAAYNETFVDGEKKCPEIDSDMATGKLVIFLQTMVGSFFDLLKQRVKTETSLDDIAVVVRALDRFYRRLQGELKDILKLYTHSDIEGTEILYSVTLVKHYVLNIFLKFVYFSNNEVVIDESVVIFCFFHPFLGHDNPVVLSHHFIDSHVAGDAWSCSFGNDPSFRRLQSKGVAERHCFGLGANVVHPEHFGMAWQP